MPTQFIIVLVFVQFIWAVTLQGQSTVIAPSWSVLPESRANVRVGDSIVVLATKDSVIVYEAATGVRRYAWKPGVEIGGLALEPKGNAPVLSTLRFVSTRPVVQLRFYSLTGELRDLDSFDVPVPFETEKLMEGINAISISGRFIVFGSHLIFDRVTRNAINIRGYYVKSVSFNVDESACIIHSGQWSNAAHGTTIVNSRTQVYSLVPSLWGEISIPNRPTDGLAQFIPHTNLLWNDSEILSYPDWKVVRITSRRPYGRYADDGYRTAWYDYFGSGHSVFIRGYAGGKDYRLAFAEVRAPFLYNEPWYETNPSLTVVALPGDTIHVYAIPKTDLKPGLDWIYFPTPILEHSPVSLLLDYHPVTQSMRLRCRVDGTERNADHLYLAAGEHRVAIDLHSGDSLVESLDSTILVGVRDRSPYSLWVGGVPNGLTGVDLSPSGNKIVMSGNRIYLADLIGDTLSRVSKDEVYDESRPVVKFISNHSLLLSTNIQTEAGPSGGLAGSYTDYQILKSVDVATGIVRRGGFSHQWYGNEPGPPKYTGGIDRIRGRGLFYTGGFDGDSNSVVWVVTDTSLISETPCFYSPRFVVVDPSTDSPLLIGTLTINAPQTRTSRRIDGQSRTCLELIGLPSLPMMFVHDGKILWSRDGTYDSQTGLKIASASLQENCIAVPHSSLVLCPAAQPHSSPTDLVFYSAQDARPLATVHYGASIGTIICDTSGRRLLITRGYPGEVEVLNLESIIKDNGLEQYYLDSPTSVSETNPALSRAPRPNPASDIVRFDWPSSYEVLQFEVRDLMGVLAWSTNATIGSSYIDWNLQTSSGQRVAPGMYGFLLRTQDGRIVETGTFIVAPE